MACWISAQFTMKLKLITQSMALTALMEPMIMAVLGVLVGGLMIAMYLPIFQLGAVM